MDFSLFEFLGFGGTGLAVTAAVLALSWNADDAFSEEPRQALSRWLQRLEVKTEGVTWHQAFAATFDRVFGIRHFTWRCFARSVVASLVAVALLFLLWLVLYSEKKEQVPLIFASNVVFILVIGLALNAIADYLSLLESRLFLRWMKNGNSTARIAILLFLDVLVSGTIFLVVAPAAFSALAFGLTLFFEEPLGGVLLEFSVMFLVYQAALVEAGLFNFEYNFVLIFFFSTYFTSVWLWLHAFGWFVVRNGARFQRVLALLQWLLPIKTKPMRAVGEVAALAVALTFVLLGTFGVDFGSTG